MGDLRALERAQRMMDLLFHRFVVVLFSGDFGKDFRSCPKTMIGATS